VDIIVAQDMTSSTQIASETEPSRIALVTGASSGIGRAIALRLSKDGFHVFLHFNKNAKGAEETFQQITSQGGRCEVLQFDVKDPVAVETTLEKHLKALPDKKLYALINNAGVHNDGLLGLMSDAAFDDVLKTNVYGPFYLMRWCVRKMIKNRDGVIVNISSLSGQTGNAGQINYAASKAALIAMTKSLSQEIGSRGIRVNAVAPGLIETEMIQNISQIDEMKKRIPLGRFGSASEVAAVTSFLCSKDSSYVTGHTLSVNGGLFPT
jgi:3-oxoacyl-[acyl-carrier protein] reductase